MAKVKVTARLYRPGPRPGSLVLVAVPGSELPEEELRALLSLPCNAHARGRPAPEHHAVPEPEARAPEPSRGPTRAQLLVEAKRRGLEVSARATRAELLELLRGEP